MQGITYNLSPCTPQHDHTQILMYFPPDSLSTCFFIYINLINLFYFYLFLAVLGLRCRRRAFL